jgi:hypothetical protein
MRTFTISLAPFPDTLSRWRVTATLSQPQGVPRSQDYDFEFEFTSQGNGSQAATQNPRLRDLSEDAHGYGTILGELIFGGDVGRLFREAFDPNQDALHVILVLGEPSLEVLAWQRLCYPDDDGWEHLRLTRNLPFSIRVVPAPGEDRAVPLLDRREFEALVVAADPGKDNSYGLVEFDVAGTVAGLRQALGRIPCRVLANTKGVDGPPTMDALRGSLGQHEPSWLHVVCHGAMLHESVLYLLDEKGKVAGVEARQLIEDLKRLRSTKGLPNFAFLCACETARPQTGLSIGDLGRRLVRDAGFAAVVAMTETFSVKTGTSLSERFYYHLAFHGTVDLALNAASAELAEADDITVPTLFSRLEGRALCRESEFLDFPRVRLAWQQWLADRRSPQLFSLRQTVKSPLSADWDDFIAEPPFQRKIQSLVEELTAMVDADDPKEWRDAVRKLEVAGRQQSCEELVTAITPVLESCSPICEQIQANAQLSDGENDGRRDLNDDHDPLDELQQLVKARKFRCCFPVVGQFGSGKSYFVNQIIDASISERDARLLVLPVRPELPRKLEEQVLIAAGEAARGLRSWVKLEELDRDLAWHDATLLIIIDDLQTYLDRGAGAVGPGLTHCGLEGAVKSLSRFCSIKWLFTIQDTYFDKVAYRAGFWREFGLSADRRRGRGRGERVGRFRPAQFDRSHVHRRSREEESGFLLGWASLNDRTERDATGVDILVENLSSGETHLPALDLQALRADGSQTQRRNLSLPLVAAVLTVKADEDKSVIGVSVDREWLVNELLGGLYASHGGRELRPYINEALAALSGLFFEQATEPSLAVANQALLPLAGRADAKAVFAKLVEFGIVGVQSSDETSTSTMTYLEYRFDPIWHLFLAQARVGSGDGLLEPRETLMSRLAAGLATIKSPDHREGVGEFVLTLILGMLKRSEDDVNRAAESAAQFATEPELPNAAAFRSACYEDVGFQEPFAGSCTKSLPPQVGLRTLFSILMFVDTASEVSLASSAGLLFGRFQAIGDAGYADYCAAILARRIGTCRKELWESLPKLAGCEELAADHAFELARAVINRLRKQFEQSAASALPRLLDYLVGERARSDRDYERHEEHPHPPFFFRECLLFHFCDWYLRENRLTAWRLLVEADWFYDRAREKFGDHIAREMEREVNKAFGRWFRWNRDQSEAYRRLLSTLVDSDDPQNVNTAYFMIRHTYAPALSYDSEDRTHVPADRTHYVKPEFGPLLRRIEQRRDWLATSEPGRTLLTNMKELPVEIQFERKAD